MLAWTLGFLAVVIGWDWPRYWVNINYERSALTWFSSIQLWTIALTCLWIAWRTSATRIWWALAGAFFFFSVDERFQFHERVREYFFKPHGIGTQLPGLHAGDFLFVLAAPVGIWVASRLWRLLSRPARLRLAVGVVCAALAVVLDGFEWSTENEHLRRLQFWEEILETAAQTGFLMGFLRHAGEISE